MYREDLKNYEGCGVVVHERLTEPRVIIEWLLTKSKSLSNLPTFLDLNSQIFKDIFFEIFRFL